MEINFPVRYARKNNREKSEPKLHINFRSSLSRCQSGRVNKKTLRERETGRVVGHPEKAYCGLEGKTCVYKFMRRQVDDITPSRPTIFIPPLGSPL